jgi:hypothetical protein
VAPRFVALTFLLAACDTTIDWVVSGEADYGSVYVCAAGCEYGNEYCWDGDADELSALLGTTCRPIDASDRLWPWLAGCAYSCDGGLTGPGANAKCGTACR